jgi:hypothetical protein
MMLGRVHKCVNITFTASYDDCVDTSYVYCRFIDCAFCVVTLNVREMELNAKRPRHGFYNRLYFVLSVDFYANIHQCEGCAVTYVF